MPKPRTQYDQIALEDMLAQTQQAQQDNERVLRLRRTFDDKAIASASLIHAPKPDAEDFSAVRRFYANQNAGVIATSGMLRRMLIPLVADLPNAYRMAKKSSHLLVWKEPDGFVLNLISCLIMDGKHERYNSAKTLLGALHDGSVFWMGKYAPQTIGEKVEDSMMKLQERYEKEAARPSPDATVLHAISEEYCSRIREMRRICAQAKMRMSNIHTAVEAVHEIAEAGICDEIDASVHADIAYEEKPGAGIAEFAGLAAIDEKAFYAACDSVLRSFLGAFADAPCAQMGDCEFPEADSYKIIPTDTGTDEQETRSASAIALCEGYYEDGRYIEIDPLDALDQAAPNKADDWWNEDCYVLERMARDETWWPTTADMENVTPACSESIGRMRKRYDKAEAALGTTGGFAPIAGSNKSMRM